MPSRRHRSRRFRAILLAVLATVLSCDGDNGTRPEALRFGQVGEVRVQLIVPLVFGEGELQQVLTWSSSGAWQLFEAISYEGVLGDETLIRNEEDANTYAAWYASLITQANETPGLQLFVPELDESLNPECGLGRTRIILQVRDDVRRQERRWIRCTDGSLTTLEPGGAGPDQAAARVVQVAALARENTLGTSFQSAYHGSTPFATLRRDEDSGVNLVGIKPFFSPDGGNTEPVEWRRTWADLVGGTEAPPDVAWDRQIVLIAGVGERFEAGDSVEIRRVLPVDRGTHVKMFERIPGDFCSPASRSHYPIHVIVTPLIPLPITSWELVQERVPCGVG